MKTTSIDLQSPPDLPHSGRILCETGFDTAEKIGIARIRLSLPRCGISAVVAEFTDADRALLAWKQTMRLSDTCDFSILFTDGAAMRGSFRMSEKAKNFLSLPRIVRMALGVCPLARGYIVSCILVDKGGGPLSCAQLDGYALNQHPPHSRAVHNPASAK